MVYAYFGAKEDLYTVVRAAERDRLFAAIDTALGDDVLARPLAHMIQKLSPRCSNTSRPPLDPRPAESPRLRGPGRL